MHGTASSESGGNSDRARQLRSIVRREGLPARAPSISPLGVGASIRCYGCRLVRGLGVSGVSVLLGSGRGKGRQRVMERSG
ncbi:hypothetical protein AZ78_0225 [Lysobacter capsici AZ78]|uniref:Uncharacterized protein n=1 Tax=Lysobacter capsici AZ78 TaxID=1444315 RepID=A0A108U526_9GAMM|nr:hypothetical protein AZ78_0225 [Lysobacter capsici AZ78]